MERQFVTGDALQALSSLNYMMGRETQNQHCLPTNIGSFANELNQFYSRFDKTTHAVRADKCVAMSGIPSLLQRSWLSC